MKILSHISLLLTFLIVLTTSCKKEGYNQPNADCYLVHSEDDLYGYSFDIMYNSTGNPASIDLAGFPVSLEYDASGRLSKAYYGSAGARLEFFYSYNTFLPTVRKYIRPDFGGLISVDSFSYNIVGQRTKMITHILLSGADNKLIYKYQYDNRGNLKKLTSATVTNGIESSPELVFEGLRYDNKYNALSGNQWLKYLFDLTDFTDYSYLQFSVNNALDWKWYYGDDIAYSVTSSLIYNSQGFANTRNGHYFDTDGVTELASFTQLNISSCDATAPRLTQKASIFKNRKTGKWEIFQLPFINKQ